MRVARDKPKVPALNVDSFSDYGYWRFPFPFRKHTQAYENPGLAKQRKGDLDGAIADFSQAIELDPRLADAYQNRGLAKSSKGDSQGSADDYERAKKLKP
jgi:tetratricopeptide (TPR) repeat protein